jgi:hypothetical protein
MGVAIQQIRPRRFNLVVVAGNHKSSLSFGKIVVENPTVADDAATMIGLHVEKGVGPTAAPIFDGTPRGRRLVMQRDWRWHRFAADLASGSMDTALAVVPTDVVDSTRALVLRLGCLDSD